MNIKIELNNINLATNIYNSEFLKEDLDKYILNNCYRKFINNKITLTIIGLNDNRNQEYIANLIHNHYKNKLYIAKKEDKLDDYFKTILFIIGVIAILLSEQFNYFFNELFLIAGWVTIWEIIYDLLFVEIRRKRNTRIYKALSLANIVFQN